jgi:hypothetical protein
MSSRRSAAKPGRPSRGRRANGAHSRCQQDLGADEEAEPGRAGQAPAETGERQTISRPPAWPLDLALEDAQLVPEDQQLEPEAGVRASAIDEGIEEQTEDGIEESEKHGRAS